MNKFFFILVFPLGIINFCGCQSSPESESQSSPQSSSQNTPQREIIQSLDSYQNNLRERDIASFFRNTVNRYLSNAKYYHVSYDVSFNKNEQNYAWKCIIVKETFRWGVVYDIKLYTLNGVLTISTSNVSFTVGQENSREIITFERNSVGWGRICQYINDNILAFMNETAIALRQNGLFLTDSVSEAFSELNMFR
jgi:hypothetical protein